MEEKKEWKYIYNRKKGVKRRDKRERNEGKKRRKKFEGWRKGKRKGDIYMEGRKE